MNLIHGFGKGMYYIMGKYMKTRVGLKPEEYSKEETKYDEQRKVEKG